MGGTWFEGVWEHGAEENIWSQDRRRKWRCVKLHSEELHVLCCSLTRISQGEQGRKDILEMRMAYNTSERTRGRKSFLCLGI
jgi:hypothetical protein